MGREEKAVVVNDCIASDVTPENAELSVITAAVVGLKAANLSPKERAEQLVECMCTEHRALFLEAARVADVLNDATAPERRESRVDTQVRLVQETQCRKAADLLAKSLPAGVGFCLVIADHGERGNMSYVSSIERPSAAVLLLDLVGKWKAAGEVPR